MIASRHSKAGSAGVRLAANVGRIARGALAVGALVALAAGVDCSSSKSSTPCNQNPWECPSGQTCWPVSASSFECLNSGSGGVGDSCVLSVGTPTCSDGLTCLATSAAGGACAPYCDTTDTAHACASTQECETAFLPGGNGVDYQVCVSPSPGDGGGSSSGGGSSGSGDASAESSTDASSVVGDASGQSSTDASSGSDATPE